MSHKIAIVEDDPHIQDIVNGYLKKEGYETTTMDTAEKAWELWRQTPPDLWVLDIMLPGMDGYEFCRRIRQETEAPIIIISARDEEVDRILGLELGSDDYLTKPFSPRELVARVKRTLRRWEQMQEINQESLNDQELKSGDLRLSVEERRVFWKNKEAEVTAKEFDLLYILINQENRAFSREELLNQVWGNDYFGSDRAVDDLVKRLRKKLTDIPLETVWGFGYRLRRREGE